MFKKSLLLSTLLLSMGAQGASGSEDKPLLKPFAYEDKVNYVIAKDAENATNNYFVQLRDLPAAFIKSSGSKTKSGKLNLKSSAMQSKMKQLKQQQSSFLTNAKSKVGGSLDIRHRYSVAFNGFSMELTESQAEKLLEMPEVLKVVRQTTYEMQTDVGPQHVGADIVWEPAEGIGAKGEGVIVGIIDSGINTDHPSFASSGDDGYTHTNPNGSGVFFGDCVDDQTLCNDKLIGVFSYDSITSLYEGVRPENGIDYNGHGSHVASTAAGNVLNDLPYYGRGSGETSEGEPIAGTNIAQMSGVAPHANIISFQVCLPTSGCAMDAMLQAVEDSIVTGVDVINMSIGPSGQGPHPWLDPLDMGFLAANEAGIFTALSAGNSGSGNSTVGHLAPWTTQVANATHGRIFTKTVNSSASAATQLTEISGVGGVSNEVTAEIIYAGDISAFNTQCNFLPFRDYPEIEGKIILCDRGSYSLFRMSENVSAHGGLGVVIRNMPESETELHSLPYVVPGIQINEVDGNALFNWMQSEVNPEITISAGTADVDPSKANILNATSSRGPNSNYPNLLVPHVSAPGTEVYAAFTDEQPFHGLPAPSDYAFLSGTSMASPHVTGAAALMKQLHPDWTPAEIQSALMMTANTSMLKEDAATPADIWDRGAGMIQVDKAVNAGLVLDVRPNEYLESDPAASGDPTTLNTAYLVDANCPGTCRWTRTFRATQDGVWDFAMNGRNFSIDALTIEPATVEVAAGDEVTVEISATFKEFAADDWIDTSVIAVPTATGATPLVLPMRIKPLVAEIPKQVKQDYYWNEAGFDIEGFMFRRPEQILINNTPLTKAQSFTVEAGQDSSPLTPFDDLTDGVAYFIYELEEATNAPIDFIISGATNADNDIFIGIDNNNDGVPQSIERVCVAATNANVGERCQISGQTPGKYWVMVWNYEGSTEGTDSITVDIVENGDNVVAMNAVAASTGVPFLDFPVSILWQGMIDTGSNYYGSINILEQDLFSGSYVERGTTQLILSQKGKAVDVSLSKEQISIGESFDLTVDFSGNTLNEDFTIELKIELNDGFELLQSVDGVEFESGVLTVKHDVSANDSTTSTLTIPLALSAQLSGNFVHNYTVKTTRNDNQQKGLLEQYNPNTAPEVFATVDQSEVFEGDTITLSSSGSDAEGDDLTYTWTQVQGPSAFSGTKSGQNQTVTAPTVEGSATLAFDVVVSDGEFNSKSVVMVTVNDAPKGGGGSSSWLLLFLLSSVIVSRRLKL